MKGAFVLLSAFVAISIAAPITEDGAATIVQYDNTSDGKGNYEFSFLTSNGIKRKEKGTLVNAGLEDEHIEVEGEVSYTDEEGKLVVIRYTAGEKGYQVMSLPSFVPSVPFSGVSPNVIASLLGKK